MDLHWASADPNYSFSTTLDYYSDRLGKLEIQNQIFKVHNTDDLFVQLCIHGAKHNWSRFNWIADIANLTAVKEDIDYRYVLQEAKKLGCINIVAFSIGLINNLFNLDIPLVHLESKIKNNLPKKRLSLITSIFNTYKNNNKSYVSIIPEQFDSYSDRACFYINKYIYPTPIELSFIQLNRRWFFSLLYYQGSAYIL